MVPTLDDFTITPNEERDLASWLLKDAYDNIVPCSGSKSYCEDITDYPSREIDAVLLPNLQQEYFNKVFTGHTDKACQKTSEQVIGQTASNLSNYNLFYSPFVIISLMIFLKIIKIIFPFE